MEVVVEVVFSLISDIYALSLRIYPYLAIWKNFRLLYRPQM